MSLAFQIHGHVTNVSHSEAVQEQRYRSSGDSSSVHAVLSFAHMDSAEPKGELVIRTIAMPKDTNPNGDIFGGWLMSQMDLGSGILAAKTAQSRVVTVAMEGMSFLQPVRVGDTVACYAWVEKIGRTSMVIPVEVWVQRYKYGEELRVTHGVFTYVAVDNEGKPIPVRRET
ncbi:MAG: acyl-CoA thioesterase YciA [Verrucomicrobiota bacterium]